jgi:multimeric flavodoxin WrbA
MSANPQLLIVYHSMTGGTRQMAEAARDAALAEAQHSGGLLVRCLHASEAGPIDVLAANGLIFATPEYLGAMSGLMKDFFDRCYHPVLDQLNGRPYATLVCAGSDGQPAARQVARIVTGWRLKAVAEPVIVCTRAQTASAIAAPKLLTDADLAPCAALGEAMAAGLVLGVF